MMPLALQRTSDQENISVGAVSLSRLVWICGIGGSASVSALRRELRQDRGRRRNVAQPLVLLANGHQRRLAGVKRARPTPRPRFAEDVAAAADADGRRPLRPLEQVVAFLEVVPERLPRRRVLRGHVRVRHAERKHMDRHDFLSRVDRRHRQLVDLVQNRIGHCKAADRRAAAVDQDVRSRPRLRLIEDIGKADVERLGPAPDVAGLGSRHCVVAFRRLLVAVSELRPYRAGPVADGIGRKQDERVILLLPDLEFGFGFEDADQNGRRQRDALVAQPLLQHGDVRRSGQRQGSGGCRPLALDTIGGNVFELDGKRIRLSDAGETEAIAATKARRIKP